MAARDRRPAPREATTAYCTSEREAERVRQQQLNDWKSERAAVSYRPSTTELERQRRPHNIMSTENVDSAAAAATTATATSEAAAEDAQRRRLLEEEEAIWPTDPTAYELLGKIGQGAFATVWRAKTTCCTTAVPAAAAAAVVAPAAEAAAVAAGGGGSSEQQQQQQECCFECAVKVLNLDHVDTNLAEIRGEVQAMRLSSHPNVLPCYAAFCNETNLWLVTQFMNKGSSLHCLQTARRVLKRKQKRREEWEQRLLEGRVGADDAPPPDAVGDATSMEEHILYILHETLQGLQYIHENGQIHRDIKAGNILLDGRGHVKIADFGVSGWLIKGGEQSTKAKTFVGTPCWMAPEVMEQVHGYDTKADIWSLGITALELARGYAPYAKHPPMKVLILTIQEDPPSLETYDEYDDDDDDDYYNVRSEQFTNQFSNFVDTCLQKNPAKRPTTQGLLESKYLNKFRDEPYLEQCRLKMVRQVCDIVPDVGISSSVSGSGAKAHDDTTSSTSPTHNNAAGGGAAAGAARKALPGNSPVSILLSQETKDRPAGTTWVFADGSTVLSSSQTDPHSVDDVMEALDAFGQETGGEHYYDSKTGGEGEGGDEEQVAAAAGSEQHQEEGEEGTGDQQGQHGQQPPKKKDDDLDAFMDEFELNTGGEDFRR